MSPRYELKLRCPDCPRVPAAVHIPLQVFQVFGYVMAIDAMYLQRSFACSSFHALSEPMHEVLCFLSEAESQNA